MGQASDLAQGWEERHKEFEDFELKFEVNFVFMFHSHTNFNQFSRKFPTVLTPSYLKDTSTLALILLENCT